MEFYLFLYVNYCNQLYRIIVLCESAGWGEVRSRVDSDVIRQAVSGKKYSTLIIAITG